MLLNFKNENEISVTLDSISCNLDFKYANFLNHVDSITIAYKKEIPCSMYIELQVLLEADGERSASFTLKNDANTECKDIAVYDYEDGYALPMCENRVYEAIAPHLKFNDCYDELLDFVLKEQVSLLEKYYEDNSVIAEIIAFCESRAVIDVLPDLDSAFYDDILDNKKEDLEAEFKAFNLDKLIEKYKGFDLEKIKQEIETYRKELQTALADDIKCKFGSSLREALDYSWY